MLPILAGVLQNVKGISLDILFLILFGLVDMARGNGNDDFNIDKLDFEFCRASFP